MKYCLAIDVGASGGRHILGYIENGRLIAREVYRFENGMKRLDGSLVWDIDLLFAQIKKGLRLCAEAGTPPDTVAIDTWGVDYVLIDGQGKPISPVYAYRDGGLSDGNAAEAEKNFEENELYLRTGIQYQPFNTVYQLYLRRNSLAGAKRLLMMPEYLSYRLTGVMKNEYTNATTTGLINAVTGDWDLEILSKLGIDRELFSEPVRPPAELGGFSREIKEELGFDARVLLCPSHDTASAVAACPLDAGGVFISSGTWSLVGTELEKPIISRAARLANFTNEGGIGGRFRFLKNIMGMWLLQGMRESLGRKYSYDEMMNMAEYSGFTDAFDPNDPSLTSPADMAEAVRKLLGRPRLPDESVLGGIYHSLAASYKRTVEEIERLTGRSCAAITIMGGGSRDAYLNRLTKEYTGKRVLAGPVEATAAGNLMSQLMWLDGGLTIEKGRELIKKSFDIVEV